MRQRSFAVFALLLFGCLPAFAPDVRARGVHAGLEPTAASETCMGCRVSEHAPVDRVALSPDDTRLISVDRSAVVHVWEPASAALLETIELDGRIEQLAIAGGFFAVVDALGGAQLWSLATDERIAEFTLGPESVTGLAVAPDGSAIALGRSGRDGGAVELWRPSSPEAVARFRAVAP